jgi:hypothetical protein
MPNSHLDMGRCPVARPRDTGQTVPPMSRTGKPTRAVRALATCATAALLGASAGAGAASADTASFASTGGEQTFTVPAGVTSLQVVAVGGRGGGTFGGFGAVARATVPVTPGQTLFVNVGGNGTGGEVGNSETGPAGGFNGGGSGGRGSIIYDSGDSGGGASDVRSFSRSQPSSLGTRLVVAGGGGGGNALGTAGGAAGSPGATGQLAPSSQPYCTGGSGGSPGTASAGGPGGAPGKLGSPPVNPDGIAGTNGQIGDGGSGGGDAFGGGGGGGGGLFGGGGGGSATGDFNVYTGCTPGGGGGGSSGFVASATSTSVSPDTSGAPSVTLEWTAASGPPPSGPGGPGGPGGRDAAAPAVSALSLSRTAFVAANFGPSAVAAAKVGTTISYRVSEAARVTFTVERPKPGIRRGGRCVKRTRKAPANAKKCTRWVKVKGSFAQDASAGTNRIRFMGRLRGRALRRGSYRLVVTAKDAAGNTTAKPARRGFRIV